MTYQDKLEEIQRELADIDNDAVDDMLFNYKYNEDEINNYVRNIFVEGMLEGLKIALELAITFKVDKEL